MPLESLTIEDYSDREFLLLVPEYADSDGWTDSQAIAEVVGLSRRYPAQRLAWLARFGAVEREHMRDEHNNIRYRRNGKPMFTQRWRLTDIGDALAHGKLKATQEKLLEGLSDDQMLLVTRAVGSRQRHADNPTVAKLISREWRYATSAQRNGDTP